MNGFKILFANLYDLLLLIAIWFVAAVPFVIWQGQAFSDKPIITLAFQVYIVAITYVYLTYFWIQTGQTPGLRTWKLQLVTEDQHLISRHSANLRFIFTVLFFLIGWIGLFFPKQQLLQDRFAKTKIVSIHN
ncbi:RDD family protein [Thiomicrorhabdus sp. Milos-T2]|uniref:RDD family protein n=1 Tax=Thiomicrorhabdus sp. Milos-T2 TaxID=90814 RepID=UPI0004945004|nr:RDD family protein [Thiomicrorhabdus sp. Milos-T2]